MSQRSVERLIGRLIADEQFRAAFLDDPEGTLAGLRDRGFELTPTEVAALMASDRTLWACAAERLDARLQKASLVTSPTSSKESAPHA